MFSSKCPLVSLTIMAASSAFSFANSFVRAESHSGISRVSLDDRGVLAFHFFSHASFICCLNRYSVIGKGVRCACSGSSTLRSAAWCANRSAAWLPLCDSSEQCALILKNRILRLGMILSIPLRFSKIRRTMRCTAAYRGYAVPRISCRHCELSTKMAQDLSFRERLLSQRFRSFGFESRPAAAVLR